VFSAIAVLAGWGRFGQASALPCVIQALLWQSRSWIEKIYLGRLAEQLSTQARKRVKA
jgi:hypothetical protein